MGSQTWAYTPDESPWSKKTLIVLWVVQIVYIAILSILTTAFQIHENLNWCTLQLLASAAFSFIVFTIQIIQYRRHRLSPVWMVVMSVIQCASWTTVTIIAGLSSYLPWDECFDCLSTWTGLRVTMILDCFVFLPSLCQMAYVCHVLDRFKKSRLRLRDERGRVGTELTKV